MNQFNKKQKKLLLVLPLLILPFATMFFWALGGGQTQARSLTGQLKGLNMQLPGAQLKNDSTANKLSFYEQAEKDSLKFKQARKDDPYYKEDTLNLRDTGITPVPTAIPDEYGNIAGSSFLQHNLTNPRATLAASEQQIHQKLAQLNKQINQPSPQPPTDNSIAATPDRTNVELSHLQATMQQLNTADAPDPQMQQLSGMLDKILDIEHPELAKQKIKAQSEKERGIVLPVSSEGTTTDETLMKGTTNNPDMQVSYTELSQPNGFFDLDHPDESQAGNAINAVVHETRTVTAGSTVKLRLLQGIYINGKLIPKNSFVYGTCSIEGERLNIDIKTIRSHSSVFPVSMRVFDQDGLAGIYVPGAITRDVAKEGADEAVQSYNPMTYDPSLGAQAANAGISVAKGLFSKKVKLIKVTVKAGYAVLLVNSNQLNQ